MWMGLTLRANAERADGRSLVSGFAPALFVGGVDADTHPRKA